jgi:3-methyladenine DNA glycosylase AlkC
METDNSLQDIIKRISGIENGFKPIESEARKLADLNSIEDTKNLANHLLTNHLFQIRSLAVFLLGLIAADNSTALQIMKTEVSLDTSWQVQEILAKSFDQYCHDTGYEKSVPIIENWLDDTNPAVCRAVTEGLRIWTSRPYFKENPDIAIQLISRHKANPSEYLRKSVGNSLRDIAKRHKDLVNQEILTWDLSNKLIYFTFKLATKTR